MNSLKGGCHCGNISIALELSRAPSAYNPRACDCDFCRKHGAAYISDPHGSIRIHINSAGKSQIYRQGSGTAEFLLCAACGVVVSVLYRDTNRVYAAANANTVATAAERFGSEQSASPQMLAASDKVKRWQTVWFPNATLTYGEM